MNERIFFLLTAVLAYLGVGYYLKAKRIFHRHLGPVGADSV
jgi:hypothetical protein